jgi:hypothetical protein
MHDIGYCRCSASEMGENNGGGAGASEVRKDDSRKQGDDLGYSADDKSNE